MGRRGENIYKRKDGRWEGRYSRGRRSDGSIHYGYVYATTYKEIKNKLMEKQLILRETDPDQVEFKGTVDIWLDYWLKSINKAVKPATYSSYKNKMEKYVRPYIGKLTLKEITGEKLNQLINYWEGSLSPSSIRTVFQILKSCLKEAEKRRFISSQIFEEIKLPKVSKKRIHALTSKERETITQLAEQDAYGFPIILSLETGLRIGEISGLKWEDIDFVTQTLTVSRTLQRLQTFSTPNKKTSLIEGTPKTQMSIREIPLSERMLSRLNELKDQSDSDYVVSRSGKPMEPRTITNHFKRIISNTDIAQISFHSLRHSFATRCLECGINIAAISALLGHTSVKLTLDIYTNTTRSEERRAIEILAS